MMPHTCPRRFSSAGRWPTGWTAWLLLLSAAACDRILGIEAPVSPRGDGGTQTMVALLPDGAADRAAGDGARGDGGCVDNVPEDLASDANLIDGGAPDGTSDDGGLGDDAMLDTQEPSDGMDLSDEHDGGEGAVSDAANETDAGPPLTIGTTALPAALYNVPYSLVLKAEGGGDAGLSWRISRGMIPQGMNLDIDGTFHGISTQEGGFQFDVSVSAGAGNAGATRTFSLEVVRKHWLLYRANTEEQDHFALYAVDTRTPAISLRVSSNISAVTGSVDKFEFSPDGKWVAFLGSPLQMNQLYVTDMTGEVPGPPRKVNEYGGVDNFAWSPDSRWLAFGAFTETATDILVADLDHQEAHPLRVADTLGFNEGLVFIDDELLTYWVETLGFARRVSESLFGPPRLLNSYGNAMQTWSDPPSALFASNFDSCQQPLWTLIDFRDPLQTRQLEGFVYVSPARDYLAHRRYPDLDYRIYTTWGTEPLASFSTSTRYCSPGSWSHDSRTFVAGADDGRVQVTRIDGGVATTAPLAGSYGVAAENGPPRFSPDDRWLAFPTDLGAYVATNDHGDLGEPAGGALPISAPFGEPIIAFAPSSAFLVAAERASSARSAVVTLVDLRQVPTKRGNVSITAAREGSGAMALGWSVHSTEFAFLMRDGSFPAATNLYLGAPPTAKTWDFLGSVSVTGFTTSVQIVTSFQFQP